VEEQQHYLNMYLPSSTLFMRAAVFIIHYSCFWFSCYVTVLLSQVTGMIPGCFKQIDVYFKNTTGGSYTNVATFVAKDGGTRTLSTLIPFTEYAIKAIVTSPDGKVKQSISSIKMPEDGKHWRVKMRTQHSTTRQFIFICNIFDIGPFGISNLRSVKSTHSFQCFARYKDLQV
jgi:hypothetical protein